MSHDLTPNKGLPSEVLAAATFPRATRVRPIEQTRESLTKLLSGMLYREKLTAIEALSLFTSESLQERWSLSLHGVYFDAQQQTAVASDHFMLLRTPIAVETSQVYLYNADGDDIALGDDYYHYLALIPLSAEAIAPPIALQELRNRVLLAREKDNYADDSCPLGRVFVCIRYDEGTDNIPVDIYFDPVLFERILLLMAKLGTKTVELRQLTRFGSLVISDVDELNRTAILMPFRPNTGVTSVMVVNSSTVLPTTISTQLQVAQPMALAA